MIVFFFIVFFPDMIFPWCNFAVFVGQFFAADWERFAIVAGYEQGDFPYIRKGAPQWQAIKHVFTVDNEIDQFEFEMSVLESMVVYDVTVRVDENSRAEDAQVKFIGQVAPQKGSPNPVTESNVIKGHLNRNDSTKSWLISLSKLCAVGIYCNLCCFFYNSSCNCSVV